MMNNKDFTEAELAAGRYFSKVNTMVGEIKTDRVLFSNDYIDEIQAESRLHIPALDETKQNKLTSYLEILGNHTYSGEFYIYSILNVDADKYLHVIQGETFKNKELFKKYGFKWNPLNKAWELETDLNPDQMAETLHCVHTPRLIKEGKNIKKVNMIGSGWVKYMTPDELKEYRAKRKAERVAKS